ncbi:HAD family hydrolase [Streptomyces sp. NPDC006879]|uniref:HAD family hydrolase n=1 Tax=Streptomyces sp. NPDC006879 TaxID=3364767 RepID=UPI003680D34B
MKRTRPDTGTRAARTVFFEVDHALTTSPSPQAFLRHYLAALGRPATEFEERRRKFKAMARLGCSTELTLRTYFADLAGARAATVSAIAEEWFRKEQESGTYYHPHALAELRRHQVAGDHLVLLSGSFPACLHLIAADLRADEVWCTEPEIRQGHYTGALSRPPMTGRAKAYAVHSVATRRRTAPPRLLAYAARHADLPMLRAAGAAVVVGGDRLLRATARANGWRQLPSVPLPPDPVQPFPSGAGRAPSTPRTRPLLSTTRPRRTHDQLVP